MAMDCLAGFDVLVLDIGAAKTLCAPSTYGTDLPAEGTVCPISFVHDVLFPYALAALDSRLDAYWDSSDFAPYRNAFPAPCRDDCAAFVAHVRELVNKDVKAPYLKALQGNIWHQGYESGDLEAPIFPDVGPFITAASASGKKIIIYSSGSVLAQKLFFSHTTAQPSDLTPFISAYYDTVNAGPKTKTSSYTRIMSSGPDVAPARWLFLSDNLEEVGAAIAAGMRSLPVARPGNAPLPPGNPLSQLAIGDFAPESAGSIAARLAELAEMPKPIPS